MAPEQAKGKVAGKRADIWAFGVVLYEMLTGRRAFNGGDVSEVMAKAITLELEGDALPTALPPPTGDLPAALCAEGPEGTHPRHRGRAAGDGWRVRHPNAPAGRAGRDAGRRSSASGVAATDTGGRSGARARRSRRLDPDATRGHPGGPNAVCHYSARQRPLVLEDPVRTSPSPPMAARSSTAVPYQVEVRHSSICVPLTSSSGRPCGAGRAALVPLSRLTASGLVFLRVQQSFEKCRSSAGRL